jgi:hypothetical protein
MRRQVVDVPPRAWGRQCPLFSLNTADHPPERIQRDAQTVPQRLSHKIILPQMSTSRTASLGLPVS